MLSEGTWNMQFSKHFWRIAVIFNALEFQFQKKNLLNLKNNVFLNNDSIFFIIFSESKSRLERSLKSASRIFTWTTVLRPEWHCTTGRNLRRTKLKRIAALTIPKHSHPPATKCRFRSVRKRIKRNPKSVWLF